MENIGPDFIKQDPAKSRCPPSPGDRLSTPGDPKEMVGVYGSCQTGVHRPTEDRTFLLLAGIGQRRAVNYYGDKIA